MRADNQGEGGILALMALVPADLPRPAEPRRAHRRSGLFGAALLYGDGMITPAITVLGAIEGLNTATPLFAALRRPAHGGRARRRCSSCSTAARPTVGASSDR